MGMEAGHRLYIQYVDIKVALSGRVFTTYGRVTESVCVCVCIRACV